MPGCFIIQSQRALIRIDEWVGFSLPLSPSFLDPVEILDIASSHPCREFDSGSLTGCQVCYFTKGERKQWFVLLVLIQGLSLSSGHEALTPHCVVVMLLLLLFGYHGAGRCPGQSRGFAFVEFNVIQEATRWMETNQVTLPYTDTHTHIYMHTVGHMG